MTTPAAGTTETGKRRWRLRLEADNYYLVLVAIIVEFLMLGLLSDLAAGRAVILATVGIVFFLVLRASDVRLSTRFFALAVVLPIVAVVIAVAVSDSPKVVGTLATFMTALLILACATVIGRRLARHKRISLQTVMGTLCIYLFMALFFAALYGVMAHLLNQPFFAQDDESNGVRFIYFSLMTITTTGFGDLTPATDTGRMMAVVEALLGQLYLVTVVALIVGNLGLAKRPPDEGSTGS